MALNPFSKATRGQRGAPKADRRKQEDAPLPAAKKEKCSPLLRKLVDRL